MSAVYSTRLVDLPSVGPLPPTGTFLVGPAGFRAVIKNLTITWGNILTSGLDAGIRGPSGAYWARITYSILNLPISDLGGTQQWYGQWVLDEGETITWDVATGTVDMHASGYLLTLP